MKQFKIIDKLFDIGAIKFGDFTLKSGLQSPFYIDLRLIFSHPELLEDIAEIVWQKSHSLEKDHICGVPYTALPIASHLSVKHKLPMLLKRKEAKQHGTKKLIEGSFNPKDTCLLVEDIITSGKSLLETISPLEDEGLVVSDIVVIIDREQGGKTLLEKQGYHVHTLFPLSMILSHLQEKNLLSKNKAQEIQEFIESNQVTI